jgi:FG-GAP-like repeat
MILLAAIPVSHADYRIGSSASDSWPSTNAGGIGISTALKMADPAGTGANEIISGGSFNNGTSYAQLRFYHKNGGSLVLDQNQLFAHGGNPYSYYVSGAEVADIDGNGVNDTIFVTNNQPLQNNPPNQSQIGIYRWTGSSLIKEKMFNFTGPNNLVETRSIAIWNYGGVRQIVTLGYYPTGTSTSAQLGIWSFDGAAFTRNALMNWTTPGSANAGAQGYSVATGDVDADGVPDIVTVGSSSNGTTVQSQVRVWGWTGSGSPLTKQYRDFLTTGQGSLATSVAIRDLAGDGKKEIIVGGQLLTYPFWKGELSVWSDWTGSLTQLAETNWQTSSQSSIDIVRVATGDVNGDGVTEIVTAGYTNIPVGSTDAFYATIRTWTWIGSTITLQKSIMYQNASSALIALTVGDVDKVGKQDIIVGGQQSSKGTVEVKDVTFVNTTIALSVSPSPSLSSQTVTVYGTLTNQTDRTPLASAPILLEYASGGGSYSIIATTTTDSQGRFATSFTPPGTGGYTIRATYSGDENHMGMSSTATLTVSQSPSGIVLVSSELNAKPGDVVTLSGYLYPATIATITLTYKGPSGTVNHAVTSDATGAFSDTYTVDQPGKWTVSASWQGSSSMASSTSNAITLQSQPDRIELSLALYGFVVAIAALGLASVTLLRKKTGISATPPAPKPSTPS